MAEGTSDRFEDVFQDEILKIIPNDEFKEFARSRSGLCLDERVIINVINDNPKAVDQKMKMLFKWRDKNPGATVDTIRDKAKKFITPDIDQEFYDNESSPLTETIRIYPNRTIGARDWILEGKQKMIRGCKKLAIKLLKWDEDTEKEASILLQLESHQNVVACVASGSTKQGFMQYLYIAMELCHERNLQEHIESQSETFDYEVAYSRAKQLICGLEHIHSKGIRHRDLKPHNVLLTLDLRNVKIADFGLSKDIPGDRSYATSTSKAWLGTTGYRSPESYNDGKYTERGDVYSLGLVIHFVWSDGNHPFGGDPDMWNYNIKTNSNRDFTSLLVPHRTKAKKMLDKMLQLNPDDRPTAEALKKEWDIRENDLDDVVERNPAAERERKEHILIFMKTSQNFPLSLCSFDPEAQTDSYDDVKLEKIVEITEWGNDAFSAVVAGECVYVLTWIGYLFICRPLDPKPSWKRVNNATEVLHGRWPSAVVIGDLIYICGGGFDEKGSCTRQQSLQDNASVVINFSPAIQKCEVYDTANDAWSLIEQMSEGRRHHSMVVNNDIIFVIGGRNYQGQVLRSSEYFHPDTREWTESAPLNTPRYKASAAVYEGKIFLHGGLNDAHTTLSDVECFDSNTQIWTTVSVMIVPRSLFRVCVCDSKLFAVAGDAYPGSGLGEFPARMSIGMYDPSEKEGWKKIKALSGMSLESSATLVFKL